MDKNIESDQKDKGSATSNPLHSEAASDLSSIRNTVAPSDLGKLTTLAVMPPLEVQNKINNHASDNSGTTALNAASNDLQKGKFSARSESLLKNAFEFSPDALNGMIKDINAKLKPHHEELKASTSGKDDKATTVLSLNKDGKIVDSIVLSSSPKTTVDGKPGEMHVESLRAAAPQPQAMPFGPQVYPVERPQPQVFPVERPQPQILPMHPIDNSQPWHPQPGPWRPQPQIEPMPPRPQIEPMPRPQIDPVPRGDNSQLERIPTPDGPAMLARSGDVVYAGRGDVVWAYSGSRVYAEAGAKVRAYQGSWIQAFPGSDVHIYNAQTLIEKGTIVTFEQVGAFQNMRYPEGLSVMSNGITYRIPYGQTIGNLYGPFWVKP